MRDRSFDGVEKLKKKGKHLSWFDYELSLVVKDGEWQRALLKVRSNEYRCRRKAKE